MNETISRKRTSLSNFFAGPTLKRKRSYCSSDTTIEQEPPKKKNRVTKLIQKVAVAITSSVHRQQPPQQNKKFTIVKRDNDIMDLFQFNLPHIEWTNGSLGIILEDKEDNESIYLEFPTPPPFNIIRYRRQCLSSCIETETQLK